MTEMTYLPFLFFLVGLSNRPIGAQYGFGMGTMCSFDQNNYYYSPQCTLTNAFPFERTTGMSCEDCLKECERINCNRNGTMRCASVVYDAAYRTCDIFAVCAQPPYRLVKCPGRIYFQPTGLASCNQATTTAGPCGPGETSKIIAVKGYQGTGVTGKDVSGLDENGCARACLTGKLPDRTGYQCRSAQYRNGVCTVSNSVRQADSSLQKADGTTFFQQLCLPSNLVQNCPDIFYEVPQKIIVGYNKQTITVGTISECVRACLDSPQARGFQCTSGIFYFQETQLNCILNIENAKTQPNLYVDQTEDVETYFELNCGTGSAVGQRRLFDKNHSFKEAFEDLPLIGDWADWSFCRGRHSMQVRFRQCRELNSKKCPSEQRSCNPFPQKKTTTTTSTSATTAIAVTNTRIEHKNSTDLFLTDTPIPAKDAVTHGECLAVKINGKKNCKLGQRRTGSKKEICMRPVDC